MAFGTDILFNPRGAASQGRQLAKLDPLHAAARGAAHGDRRGRRRFWRCRANAPPIRAGSA